MEEICDLPKCSIGLVYNIIYNYGDFSEVHKNPFIHCAAAPLNVSFLKEMIEANKSLYLDETQQNVRKVEVSVTTNSWALQVIFMHCSIELGKTWSAGELGSGELIVETSPWPVRYCSAQARVTWLFSEMFWFSQKYAKDCTVSFTAVCTPWILNFVFASAVSVTLRVFLSRIGSEWTSWSWGILSEPASDLTPALDHAPQVSDEMCVT